MNRNIHAWFVVLCAQRYSATCCQTNDRATDGVKKRAVDGVILPKVIEARYQEGKQRLNQDKS